MYSALGRYVAGRLYARARDVRVCSRSLEGGRTSGGGICTLTRTRAAEPSRGAGVYHIHISMYLDLCRGWEMGIG